MPPVSVPLGFQEKAATEEEAFRKIIQGWVDVLGPTRITELAALLGLPANKIEAALIALEADGVVLRGEFRDRSQVTSEVEWCERGLLARIHRLTLGRLRKEIESVSAADFMKFLLAWQHLAPHTQLWGRDGVLKVIRQLQGLDLPAPAWEQYVLPGRVKDYDPADLENLCLGGLVTWGRLKLNDETAEQSEAQGKPRKRRLFVPARTAPVAFLLRDELEFFAAGTATSWEEAVGLSEMAREVGRYLEQRGASFMADIARGTGLLKIKVEEALWQLVAHGFATGDGIAGLRVLLLPETKRKGGRHKLRVVSGGRIPERVIPVGRWSLWRHRGEAPRVETERIVEHWAHQLLDRYGVVFRDLLARESCAPPWRSLLQVYRRLEARGEIRGGRFVNGFVGEQFALPEAIDMLRAERRSQDHRPPVTVSAADPLNLVGILTPGARLSPHSNQVIAYGDGVPVEVGPLGAVISRLGQSAAEIVE